MAKVIILIGKTGSGKSTLANVISGTNEFIESGSSASVTKEIKKGEFSNNGINYAVIDTVGIGDAQLEKEEVLDKIAEAVYLAREGISQVLFVVNGRFDQFEMSIYSLLSTIIFDKSVTGYTTIVRTNFPEFEREKERQKDIEEMTTSEGDLSNVIKTCCQRVVHIDNPPLDVDIPDDESDDEREEREEMISLKKKIRNKSKERVLKHLQKICLEQKEDYKPQKLQELSVEIAEHMEKKIESKKRLAEKEELRRKLEVATKTKEKIKVVNKQDFTVKENNSEDIFSADTKDNEIKSTVKKEKQKITSSNYLETETFEQNIKGTLIKLGIAVLENELKELEETKKLIEDIQKKDALIRQKVLGHILNNYNEIAEVQGGGNFIKTIIGGSNNLSANKLNFAELQRQREELEAKILEKGNDNQSLEEIEKDIKEREQKLLDLKKELLTIKEIFKAWQKQGFDVQQVQEWASVLGSSFNPKDEDDISFCIWLRDIKKIGAEEIKFNNNEKKLRAEYINLGIGDWKNIHPEFTPELQKKWKEKWFDYEGCKEWIEAGLKPIDFEYAWWLWVLKGKSSEWISNYGNDNELRKKCSESLARLEEVKRLRLIYEMKYFDAKYLMQGEREQLSKQTWFATVKEKADLLKQQIQEEAYIQILPK